MFVIIAGFGAKQGMERSTMKSYQAWSKLTGNPKGLTFEEFKHLPRGLKGGSDCP